MLFVIYWAPAVFAGPTFLLVSGKGTLILISGLTHPLERVIFEDLFCLPRRHSIGEGGSPFIGLRCLTLGR